MRIHWLKDGEQLIHDGRFKINGDPGDELVISQCQLKDSGYYQCVATNPAGQARAVSRLQVEPPGQILIVSRNDYIYTCFSHLKI